MSPSDDEDFGPALRGGPGARRRIPRPRRRTVLVVVLVCALLLVGAPLGLTLYGSAQVQREPVEGLGSAPGTQMNILVVGSDSRAGLTDEQIVEFSTGFAGGGRTDTLMLLAVRGTSAAMLSIPRDLFVTRCDGSQGRINAAYTIGDGRSCLVQTVTETTGIPISHYLELDMGSFVGLVDAVGTVEVCLDDPIRDESAAIDLPAGCQDLDTGQALGFVRARKVDDDFGRQGRQQHFVQQLAKELASPSTLLNPLRLVRVVRSGGRALTADEGFGTIDLVRFGVGTKGIGSAPSFKVPARGQTIGGAAVLVQRDEEARPIYERFRDGSVFDVDPADAEDLGG